MPIVVYIFVYIFVYLLKEKEKKKKRRTVEKSDITNKVHESTINIFMFLLLNGLDERTGSTKRRKNK